MLTRRSFLAHSAFALAAGPALLAQAPGPEVRVAQGTLRGELHSDVRVFRGVPFAKPPVGPLRFRPPQPPERWAGVRDATRFAAASLQPNAPNLPQSEDCLYLNIWTPARPAASCPVFVWIHGGGFTGGHSFDPLSEGTGFARAGVVVVTLAYRLGALGFLDVSPLLGPSYRGSGDNALRDLIAALQWVQGNIAAFGGDPKRVTIGGESAGAKLSDILMGVPSAAPLFHQIISESGGAERVWSEEQAAAVGTGFGKVWTAEAGLPVARLADAPAAQLLQAQTEFMRTWPVHFPLRGELAAGLLPARPLANIKAGSTRGKRLLIGTNRDESALFLGPHPARPVTAQDLGNLTLAQYGQVAEGYRKLDPAMTEEQLRIRTVTAEEYLVPSIRVADAHSAAGGETYCYRLDFPGEGRYAGLAFHSYDLRFVWDYFGKEQPSAAAQALANAMHAAWVAFLHGTQPGGPGLPAWPRYTPQQRLTMLLDATSHVVAGPANAELALWDGLLLD